MKTSTIMLCIIFFHCIVLTSAVADVGIMIALNSSMARIKDDLDITQTVRIAKREYHLGRANHKQVVVVRSPMGKVNNAITAQVLLSSFPIDTLISVSPGGAVAGSIHIGDIVVATKIFQHDFGTIKPYGFIWSKVPDGSGHYGHGYNTPSGALLNSCLAIAQKMNTHNTIIPGVIVSGDQFVSSPSKKEWLLKKFDAAAVDMGAGAIAQVCFANNVPFCILRVITDDAGVSARSDFQQSILNYPLDTDIPQLLKGILYEF